MIIFRMYRDFHPLRFFLALAVILLVPAFGLLVFLGLHYLENGVFSPHKWAGFTAAALAGMAVMMLFSGMIGDMLNRHRVYLEELLYRERRRPRPGSEDT